MSSPIVLITGGSRGIGAATARLAAARGYAVAINYLRRADDANAVVRELTASGGTAIAVQADVAKEDDVLRMFSEVDARLGTLTALVNNAGILERQMRLDAMTPERWTRVLATNVVGSFLCAREAVRRMPKASESTACGRARCTPRSTPAAASPIASTA
jgi:NAD(P)-dependent dehydrogenase (short-subunit alcohol dehydrogenase family)